MTINIEDLDNLQPLTEEELQFVVGGSGADILLGEEGNDILIDGSNGDFLSL